MFRGTQMDHRGLLSASISSIQSAISVFSQMKKSCHCIHRMVVGVFRAALATLLLLAFLPHGVQGAVSIDPIVMCDVSLSSGPVCAYREIHTPSIACTETDKKENCTYVGHHKMIFRFVDGTDNGTNLKTHLKDSSTKYDIGFTTDIQWNSNDACTAAINSTKCSSCTVCSAADRTFLIDCTNLAKGLITDCGSPLPVFYPVNRAIPVDPRPKRFLLNECLSHLKRSCACQMGTKKTKRAIMCTKKEVAACSFSYNPKVQNKGIQLVTKWYKKYWKKC